MSLTKPSILIISEAVSQTGYARVATGIAEQLTSTFVVHCLALNYRGMKFERSDITIHPNPNGRFAETELAKLIEDVRPAIVLMIFDAYLFNVYRTVIAKNRHQSKYVLYCPIDGILHDPLFATRFIGLDKLVLFTDWARQQVEPLLKATGTTHQNYPPIEVIPHGLDTKTFYPLHSDDEKSRRISARTAIFPERNDLHDAFLVLNANRNTTRKRIDLTLEAFSHFATGKPANVKLVLHLGLIDKGVNILELANHYHILDRLLIPTLTNNHPQVPDSQLNLIYNACDVGVNTSVGEGWGLVAFEHAATRAAQIVPAHSVCTELWQNHASLVSADKPYRHPKESTEHRVVDSNAVAAALEKLWSDPEEYDQWSAHAYTRANSKELSWPRIGAQWQQILNALL